MNKQILIVDCYDSFTYNLVHLIEKVCNETPLVIRVDECKESDIEASKAVVFSPGPGLPKETFDLMSLVKYACTHKPVLGVCLGHQAIAQSFGAELIRLPKVFHGVSRKAIISANSPMYESFEETFDAASYHSWTVKSDTIPSELLLTSVDESGEILSYRHASLPVWGVQYHPESILCPMGVELIVNWKNMLLLNNVNFD